MNACESCQRALTETADSVPEAALAHLAGCASCAELASALESDRDRLTRAWAAPVPAPDYADVRRRAASGRPTAPRLALAGALAVFTAALWFGGPPHRSPGHVMAIPAWEPPSNPFLTPERNPFRETSAVPNPFSSDGTVANPFLSSSSGTQELE